MNMSEMTKFLQRWDHSSKQKRAEILIRFVDGNGGKTGPDLEMEFANAASLFLTRLTAWLRLSYMSGEYLKLQIACIRIFVSASSGHQFLGEFIEVGGILTLLEILGLQQAKEEDKAEALRLLSSIANTGRKYRELVCESFGIRAVAECLARTDCIECQEEAKSLLQELATGNPRYQKQVYKALIALLKSSSPEAQQIGAQILTTLQPKINTASSSMVEPVLMLLRSMHLEVQFEAHQLIKLLMDYEVRDDLLKGLVALLKPSTADMQEIPEILSDPNGPQIAPPLPVYVQQAAAAKMIGILSRSAAAIADTLVKMGVVHCLLVAMGNDQYPDSQKQSGATLEFFISKYPNIRTVVREALGDSFYQSYIKNPCEFYLHATSIHLDILASNKVNITEINDE